MKLSILPATDADAPLITVLRNTVAEQLTREYGRGHWSYCVTEKGVLRGIKTSRVLDLLRAKALTARGTSRMNRYPVDSVP